MFNILSAVLVFTFALVYLSACATLNKDECKFADWRVIGYEDGSRGYQAARIGKHRSACAEYGIQPDLSAYNSGRIEGLRQYCVPANGYSRGTSGQSYNGVCSGYNEKLFLSAYNHGKEIFHEKKKLQNMKNEFSNNQQYYAELQHELKKKEDLLVSGKLSKDKALLLLNETKNITKELEAVDESMHKLEDQIFHQAEHVKHLIDQHHY